MLHILLIGVLLGWGAAIPIGPINLEIVRRNLQFGTGIGLLFGFGACSADLLYLVLLSCGALFLLTYPIVLKITGLGGAIILAWFGYCALNIKNIENTNTLTDTTASPHKQYLSGLLLTLLNPFTILFWSSISSQVVTLTQTEANAVVFAGLGVMLGTTSWQATLNLFIHITKHRLPDNAIAILNKIGGVILLGFAAFGIYHTLTL